MMTEPYEGQAVIETMQQLSEVWMQRQQQSLDLIKGCYEQLKHVNQELENKTKSLRHMRRAYELFETSLCDTYDWLSEESLVSPTETFREQTEKSPADPEELDEVLDDWQRKLRRKENEMLLRLLELLDAVERIEARWQKQYRRKTRAYRLCDKIQASLERFSESLHQHLADKYDVERLADDQLIGHYPPFETTRIEYREDANTSTNIIVARVLEHGYQREDYLLRKTTVTVTTQQRG